MMAKPIKPLELNYPMIELSNDSVFKNNSCIKVN